MRTRVPIISMVFLSILLLSACENTGKSEEIATVVVTPAIQGNSASLKVGDILEIQIPTIPTEGYAWQAQDLDTKILTQQGDRIFKGCSGIQLWYGCFAIKAVGAEKLALA